MAMVSYTEHRSIGLGILLIIIAAMTGCQTMPVVQTAPASPQIPPITSQPTSDIENQPIPTQEHSSSDIGIATAEDKPIFESVEDPVFKPVEEPTFQTVDDPYPNAQADDNNFGDSPKDETQPSGSVLTEPTPSMSNEPHSASQPASDTPPNSDIYIITPPPLDPKERRQKLLEQARQNSNTARQHQTVSRSAPVLQDGNNIPAFRRLMDTGISQLKQGKLSDAENSFTRAQRLAPQSSAVYFYLGQVALKKNQPIKAEAMARRGLTVAQSRSRKIALWQLVLRSAELRGHEPTMREARQALGRL